MNLELKRIASLPDATYGVMLLDGVPRLLTLERPWKDNAPDVSCIPAGTYAARRVISPKFGECFSVSDVPGRALIRIHWGNTEVDTDGCILLGMQFGVLQGRDAVSYSKDAFEWFMRYLRTTNEASLKVSEAF